MPMIFSCRLSLASLSVPFLRGGPWAVMAAPECQRFDAIYTSGKELCENMWDEAFAYETDDSKGFTMWFFDSKNPNDATARSLGKLGVGDHETCELQYFHKVAPSKEPDTFTECHPWKDEACCKEGTVDNSEVIKKGYGSEFHWDRCGPLTPECERFFVQEACFYECDPNAGLYRKYPSATFDPNNEDQNAWQMDKMPIKASYCDAWFDACRENLFCASDGGSFFSCAKEYEALDKSAAQPTIIVEKESDGLEVGIIVLIVVLGAVVVFFCSISYVLIMREKAGKPMFGRLQEPAASGGEVIGGQMSQA